MTAERITAVYTRVSTDQQTDASQEQALTVHLSGRAATWYRDTAGGGSTDRPELARLRADVDAGKVSAVIVWRLDRLARSLSDGVGLLDRWCKLGVRLVSLSESFDTGSAIGQVIAAVLFGFAQIEREAIRERIKAGMAARRAKGLPMGRPKGLRPKWNPAKRKVDAELARSLRGQGVSVADLCRRFKCSRAGMYKALNVR